MFGIQVSPYFINSLLTITIFPNIVIIIIIKENYMLQSFFPGLSVCCPFFSSDALLTRASVGGVLR
jgi:hypothetical protein